MIIINAGALVNCVLVGCDCQWGDMYFQHNSRAAFMLLGT